MGTTVEPPYLHKSTGIAPRNGTTTHTVTFSTDGDVPFSSATGSLLVFVIYGAVTHTATGSWTEQLQPVNSGELSVFTSTNNSSTAPPTSITVTHNGSNYPTPWCVLELPAGSTYTSGAGATPSSDTMAALTGLPGTAQLIFAAAGRASNTSGASSASSVWTAPFVEDADQFIVFGATDGAYLTVAHAINITATSVTPVYTPTYGAVAGNWAAPDREHVVFAINAVSPVTTVNKDTSFTWNVYNAITKDTSFSWRVLNAVNKDTSFSWNVYNAITKDTSFTWRVLNGLTKDTSFTWNVLNAITKDTSFTWRVLNALTKDTSFGWNVYNAITKDTNFTWNVYNAVTKDTSFTWDVLTGTHVNKDTSFTWNVYNALTKDTSFSWRVYNAVTKDTLFTWDVLSGTHVNKDTLFSWRVFNVVQKNQSFTWNVLGTSSITVTVWNGTQELSVGSVTVWSGVTELPASVTSVV